MGRNGTTKQVPWYLFPLWGLLALGVLVVIWGLYGKARLCGQTAKARQAKRAVTHGCALALGQDLTRHHCFRYCNRRSLPPRLFPPGGGLPVRRRGLPGADPVQQSGRRGHRPGHRPDL